MNSFPNRTTIRHICLGFALSCLAISSPLPAQTDTGRDSGGALALEIIRQSDPQTATEILEAVRNLLDLNEPAIAKEFLGRWSRLQLDDAQRKALLDQFGSAFLLRIARNAQLAPEGRQIATELMEAGRRIVRDPAEIARRIEQLRVASDDEKMAARRALRDGGETAAAPLLDAMVGAEPETRSEYLRALISLGLDAQPTLVMALDHADETRRVAALEALTFTGDAGVLPVAAAMYHRDDSVAVRQMAAQLLRRRVGMLPTQTEAARHLQKEIARQIRELRMDDVAASESDFDAATALPEKHRIEQLLRLGNWLAKLSPETYEDRYWSAIARLTNWWRQVGPQGELRQTNEMLFAELSSWPTGQVELFLNRAMRDDYQAAAIGFVQVLAETGSPALLTGVGGQPRPLARALSSPDRRVAFAAAHAVMQLDLAGPFPGASQMAELVTFLVRSEGSRRALVVHRRADQAGSVIGWLQELGFAVDYAASARAAEKMVGEHPDYELIVLSDEVEGASWYEVYQRLRRQPRASQLPMVLATSFRRAVDAESLAIADPLAIAYPFPYDRETIRSIVRTVQPLIRRTVVPAEERMEQARQAIQWLDRMCGDREKYQFYEVLSSQDTLLSALYVPPLTRDAMRALGHLGTPTAQWGLVDYASQPTLPEEDRQAAANAFRYAIVRRGLQLSSSQIGCQYDRYRRSQEMNDEAAGVLSFILDVIEAYDAEVFNHGNRS